MPNLVPDALEQRVHLSGVLLAEFAAPPAAALPVFNGSARPAVLSPVAAEAAAAKPTPALAQKSNAPIGVARGIHPGRVAWVHDPSAARWDGTSGYWWDDDGTDQRAVNRMVSRGLRGLTGASSDQTAWKALFRHYNRTHGRGSVGYRKGERIALKINLNNTRGQGETDNQIDASPQTTLAIVRQLVYAAGVPQSAITIYDAVRPIPDRIYSRIHAVFPKVAFVDSEGGNGRMKANWTRDALSYSLANECGTSLPTVVTRATYLINTSLLKGHRTAGVTLTAKNHYGSINDRDHSFIHASARPMGTYSPLVDLAGARDLGDKTLLYMIDALYGTDDVDTSPARWSMAPFNGRWTSSFFFSQDPVAIDSVGLDFLKAEFGASRYYLGNADNYLHEAALANAPPSRTAYRPSGRQLPSLGVHEHWNNATTKQYSRNLKKRIGIELRQA